MVLKLEGASTLACSWLMVKMPCRGTTSLMETIRRLARRDERGACRDNVFVERL